MNIKNIKNWQIKTDKGFCNFDGVALTSIDYPYEIILNDFNIIKCSVNHRFFTIDKKEIKTEDLKYGDKIETEHGFREVKEIRKLSEKEELFDILNVNNQTSSYYTNGILSHNCQFLGSSKTLINSKTLEMLDSEHPVHIMPDGLHIYEHPVENHKYVLGVDVGKGVQGDNSVIQVLDLSVTPIQQVAVFGDNNLNPRKFGKYVVKVAKMYNNAFIMLENNAEGYATAQTIWNEEEYDNLVDADTGKKDIGIRATSKSKSRAVTTLKDLIEDRAINIVDSNTIYELGRFVEVSPGRFAADDNGNDDYVTSLYWALYITTLEQYYDKEDFANIRVKQKEDDDETYEEPLDILTDEDLDDMAIFERELLRH